MRSKIFIVVLSAIFIFSISGCGIVQQILDQIDIADTFGDFAPDFSDVLQGTGDLSNKAKEAVDSHVSMTIEVNPPGEEDNLTTLDNNDYLEITISISEVPKEEFFAFLEADNIEDVPAELQEEWEKYDYLRKEGISNIIVFANGIPFDEITEDDHDIIRGMIDVNGNEGTLQALLELDIGEIPYEGPLEVGFIKDGEEWLINSLNIIISPKES